MESVMLIEVMQAVRALRRGAGPLIVSVLSLSLGIAATATVLSVVDAIDFRPIPFRSPEELVDISEADPAHPDVLGMVSPGVYLDWKERTRSTASLAAASSIVVALQDGGEGLDAARVSDSFFPTLGVQPALGRVFSADEVHRQARVAVISHDLWQSRFGGDPQVIGRTVPLSWAGEFRSVPAEPYTIVGVLPGAVRYPRGSQVWIPAAGGFGDSRSDPYLTVTGRLARGVSLDAARAEFKVISAQIAADFPQDHGRRIASIRTLRDSMRASVEQRGAAARLPLLGIAAFVLFLAVLNVAGLFLARTAAQVRELRVRLALGAPRSRLATLLLTQSLVLAFVASVVGIVISQWLIQLVSSRLQVAESGTALVLDARFALFALLLSLLSGLLVALLPVWRLARLEPREVLSAVSARGTGFARTGGVQRSMVVGQVALAVVLLSGAGLLSAEFLRLVTSETGFDPERLLVASLPIGMTASPEASLEQARQVERRIAQLGGISSAVLAGMPAEGYSYRLENGDKLREARTPMPYRVSSGYFATLRIRLVTGREFSPSDRAGSAPVGMVNRLAAELWWPDQNPVGRSVRMKRGGGTEEWVRIVGVADNERITRSMTGEIPPVLYRPFDQLTEERRRVQVFARTEHQPEAAFGSVNRAIEETYGRDGWRGEGLDTMESMLGATLAEQRFRALALALFSAVALFLAAMGIYGVVATMVSQRTREIGVRIALGARRVQVLTLVFRQGVGLAGAGFALGLVGSVGMTRILRPLLVSATGFDVRMPLAAGAVLACAVLAACYFPARRAARIDPAPLLHDA
jgi:putative ABC transport system permease protein